MREVREVWVICEFLYVWFESFSRRVNILVRFVDIVLLVIVFLRKSYFFRREMK